MTKSMWSTLKDTVSDFLSDKAMRLAAALAFYTIFSLGPVLVIVITIAGLVWGTKAATGELSSQIEQTVGPGAAQQIEKIVQAAQKTEGGVIATVISMVMLFITATGVFSQLRDAMNTIWEVQPVGGQGIWGFVRDRLLAFAVVLGIAALLMTLIIASTVVSAIGGQMESAVPGWVYIARAVELLVSVAVLTGLFAAMFKWLPDVQIQWRDVWIGAALTAVLFTLGKYGLGWYLGRSSTASVYGAAGSLVIILLWVYYSSIIFLFGAEFTQVYARRFGASIKPSARAVAVSEESRASQGLSAKRGRPRAGQRQTAARPALGFMPQDRGFHAQPMAMRASHAEAMPGETANDRFFRRVSQPVADYIIDLVSDRVGRSFKKHR